MDRRNITICPRVQGEGNDFGVVADRCDMQGGELSGGGMQAFYEVWIGLDHDLHGVDGTPPTRDVQGCRRAIRVEEIHDVLDKADEVPHAVKHKGLRELLVPLRKRVVGIENSAALVLGNGTARRGGFL